jgi:hypothetical protein
MKELAGLSTIFGVENLISENKLPHPKHKTDKQFVTVKTSS